MSIIQRLKAGLAKSRDGFARRLNSLFREGEVNESFYEEIEETLISGDVGVETTLKLLEELRQEVRQEKIRERAQVKELLQQKIIRLLDLPREEREPDQPPTGHSLDRGQRFGEDYYGGQAGHLYRSRGKKVLLVAGDTFRAAAIEQLQIWADRVGAEIIKQQPGSDPSAVFFDALNAARSRKVDVVIGDTAGRLHTKTNLMDELNKIYRVVGRCHPETFKYLRKNDTRITTCPGQGSLYKCVPHFREVCLFHFPDFIYDTFQSQGHVDPRITVRHRVHI